MPALLVAGLILSFAVPQFGLLDEYVQLIIMYVGINIILAVSLTMVNGKASSQLAWEGLSSWRMATCSTL